MIRFCHVSTLVACSPSISQRLPVSTPGRRCVSARSTASAAARIYLGGHRRVITYQHSILCQTKIDVLPRGLLLHTSPPPIAKTNHVVKLPLPGPRSPD